MYFISSTVPGLHSVNLMGFLTMNKLNIYRGN